MELVKQLCKLTSCFTLLHVLFSRDIKNEVLYFILIDIVEFVRNVFLGRQEEQEWFSEMVNKFYNDAFDSVYLQRPMKEFPKIMDMVLQLLCSSVLLGGNAVGTPTIMPLLPLALPWPVVFDTFLWEESVNLQISDELSILRTNTLNFTIFQIYCTSNNKP